MEKAGFELHLKGQLGSGKCFRGISRKGRGIVNKSTQVPSLLCWGKRSSEVYVEKKLERKSWNEINADPSKPGKLGGGVCSQDVSTGAHTALEQEFPMGKGVLERWVGKRERMRSETDWETDGMTAVGKGKLSNMFPRTHSKNGLDTW